MSVIKRLIKNTAKFVKLILLSDVAIATTVIVASTTITAFFWFFLAWLSYEDRYGIGFMDFVRISF